MTDKIDRHASPGPVRGGLDENKGELYSGVVDASATEGHDTALRPLVKDSFSYLSVFSLAFSCINSWVAIIYGLSAGLNSGGPTTRAFFDPESSGKRSHVQWSMDSSTERAARWLLS